MNAFFINGMKLNNSDGLSSHSRILNRLQLNQQEFSWLKLRLQKLSMLHWSRLWGDGCAACDEKYESPYTIAPVVLGYFSGYHSHFLLIYRNIPRFSMLLPGSNSGYAREYVCFFQEPFQSRVHLIKRRLKKEDNKSFGDPIRHLIGNERCNLFIGKMGKI